MWIIFSKWWWFGASGNYVHIFVCCFVTIPICIDTRLFLYERILYKIIVVWIAISIQFVLLDIFIFWVAFILLMNTETFNGCHQILILEITLVQNVGMFWQRSVKGESVWFSSWNWKVEVVKPARYLWNWKVEVVKPAR